MGIVNISGISDSRVAPVSAQIIEEHGGQCLIVTPTYVGAKRLASDLSFFVKKQIYVLPTDEEKFVSYEAKSRDTMLERLRVMGAVAKGEDCIVIAPASVAIKKLPPKQVFQSHLISMEVDEEIEQGEVMQALVDMGYERVPLVYAKGQFATRGGILDIFTPYRDLPVRIEFFDTLIEDIRTFQVESQRSVEKLKQVDILPAELMVRNAFAFRRARNRITRAYHSLSERRDQLLDSIETMTNIQQLENYMDYFYEEPEFIWDYMEEKIVIMDDPNRIYEGVETRSKELKLDFEVFLEQGKVVSSDIRNFSGKKELLEIYYLPKVYLCTPFPRAVKGVDAYEEIRNVQSRQTLSYNGKMDMLERDLHKYLENRYKVTIVCSTEDRYKNIQEFLAGCRLDGRIWVEMGSLTSGMDFPEEKICYITDGDIFGTYKRRRRRSTSKTKAEAIQSFADISTGDYVVHETHGIGKFVGIEQLKVKGEKKDYLKVQYAGQDILYVPATQMDLIQKYVGKDVSEVKIHKLSGSDWKATKAKAKTSIANMAKELLEISAVRNARHGHKFGPDTVWQKEFEESFPFEETADQLRCIEEIKEDMEKERAMDRLLCGDVGYGKTEVAARAMFKCAAEGKQVAVLVPTTILASQHYYTLKERFEKFPFSVDMLSRFRSEKEQEVTVDKIKKGKVDVVIGTHRLLSKDVNFKDLGLLVIDEEQRFGVQHKERIKALKKNVDVLTLSATPIPRTLHMSLIGVRDMSLIEEPPEERYPVQTYVMEEDEYVITEAIERELDRGGQVYVIYNRVAGVHRIADRIDDLVPGKRIAVGHGQMSESALEEVMMSFIDGEIDILVATTIIESGIDIPNVNTAIILDADKFGLSQLYQLRGRVGRSNRLAYAYLMHGKNKVLSDVADRRLRAIKEFTEFGAGFKISMRDLEIRGAGNLLGTEQSGHMVNIGYELYCKLVDDAVKALKGEVVTGNGEDTNIDLSVSAYIPLSYIPDEVQKLTMYKKIAAIYDEEDEKEVIEELVDRYGEIPGVTRNLIMVAKIRAFAEKLGIRKIRQTVDKMIFEYSKKSGIRPVSIFLTPGKEILVDVWEVISSMAKKSS